VLLKIPQPNEAQEVASFYLRNKEHLANSGPAYPSGFFEEDYWFANLSRFIDEFNADVSLRLFVFERTHGETGGIIGSVGFGGIMRRAAHFCYLGYGLEREKEGQGYMSESLRAAIPYVFDHLNIHRIMANYQPTNIRSGRLLRRLGFVVEGYARDYLFISGVWQDHVLTSLTNRNWRPSESL
jgi:ribosomal-protein-alanine N-acetyltransferase